MASRLFPLVLLFSVILNVACDRVPPILEYRSNGGGLNNQRIASVPVILEGQIISEADVGSPRASGVFANRLVQLRRVTVRVESVLRGDVARGDLPVFYFVNIGSAGGPARMGLVGRGGTWHIGDREIFFLKKDSGILRTVLDTYAQTTDPVLTGGHTDYKPRAGQSVFQMIVDILLTRGQGCGDQQMARAVSRSTAYSYDLAYAVQKLRRLAHDEVPVVQKAARDKLDELSYSWPKIREGWPGVPPTAGVR